MSYDPRIFNKNVNVNKIVNELFAKNDKNQVFSLNQIEVLKESLKHEHEK